MQDQTVIIISDGVNYETYGSLSEICRKYELPYLELVKLDYPFSHDGWTFTKTKFRNKTGSMSSGKELQYLRMLVMRLIDNHSATKPEAIDYLISKDLWVQ